MINDNGASGREIAIRNGLVKQCNVCKLGYEVTAVINNMIINGQTWTDIFRTTSELFETNVIKHKPSYNSIRHHGMNHIGHRAAAIRKIVERRALQAGLDVEKGSQSIITGFAATETLLNKGFERLAKGKMDDQIGPKELLAAAKQFNDMTRLAEGSADVAALQQNFNLVLRAVKEIVPESMYEDIFAKIAQLQSGEDIEEAYVLDEVDSE